MKIAIAGKGGVGKTSVTAWLANCLAQNGQKVWLVDADTASSLGQASGLLAHELPCTISSQEKLLQERIRPSANNESGFISLTPVVDDLPETFSVTLPIYGDASENSKHESSKYGSKHLLLMGGLQQAGGGCACAANALLKALLAHLILERSEWVLVDLEAGVEHLGRGTISGVDALLIVAEPSFHSLNIAGQIGNMAQELGLNKQLLIINKINEAEEHNFTLPTTIAGLPKNYCLIPHSNSLAKKRLSSSCVLDLEQEAQEKIQEKMQEIIELLNIKKQ